MITTLILLWLSTSPAVVIVDNVLFYGSDHRMRILNTGDMVYIIEDINDHVRVEYDSATGELDGNILIDLNAVIAEHEHFVFARGYFDEGEVEKAARLLEIFIKYFDNSDYLSEALYYLGQSYETMANKSEYDSLPGFARNTRINQNYYTGDAYRILINRFPISPFAAKAQYRLINIFRVSNLPWEDSVEIIEQELAMWEEFSAQYQNTEAFVSGLSEMGYLNRVLFEITGDIHHKEKAVSIFEEILLQFPSTVHAAYAHVHLYELDNNEKIYKY